MPFTFSSSSFFLLLLLLLPHISCITFSPPSSSRRTLHQPFFPLENSSPPSQSPTPSPPSSSSSSSPPSPPKYPFTSSSSSSSSTPPPTNSPFFPSYPSPPPPPSPASFASFPANISSLILPHSPTSKSSATKKLVPLSIAAVVSAVLLSSIAGFFLYRRWKNRSSKLSEDNGKTYASDAGYNHQDREDHSVRDRKQRNTNASSTSSEFLYLGTIVNSRGIEESNRNNGNAGARAAGRGPAALDPRKLDSPELQPLPPLARSFPQNFGNVEVSSTAGETEEEFYSPRGSVGGRESSIGAGSGSRRAFAAVANDALTDSRRVVEPRSSSSSYSSSSSGSGSPSRSPSQSRSHSASLSPPVSLSPRRSPQQKSPESATLEVPPPPPDAHYAIPVADESKTPLLLSSDSEKGSVSDSRVHSPSLSPISLSPDRGLDRNPDVSLRIWTVSDSNLRLLSPSLATSASGRSSTGSQRIGKSPLSSPVSESPERMSSTSLRSEQSSVYSFPISNSPERKLEERIQEVTPRISNTSRHSAGSQSGGVESKSPALGSPEKNHCVSEPIMLSPPRSSAGLEQEQQKPMLFPVSVGPPPPPPPPPPPLVAVPPKVADSPVPLTPTDQPISGPPPLTPPSRPFVMQNVTQVSPGELPPTAGSAERIDDTTPKPKLKPLHWDKVRASSDREMVWDHLRSSSFKLNEEMIETLFIVNTPNSKPKETTPRTVLPSPHQESRVLDPKKSQNIAILLRALNVTIEEVCEALLEGNAETLGPELLESLMKMAPTKEEERKLKEYKDDSPGKLGTAEKFLKAVLGVPCAFKRVEAMLYIANFESEVDYLKRSFETLEAACEELRSSRMFLKLLEAVLKTGNRMNVGTNRGDAQAFKLDTLLKLVDVKGADGKTTLLHFVVQEIIRSEGARLSSTNQAPNSSLTDDAKCRKLGLQVVSSLSSDLANVKKSAAMDSDVLSGDVNKLSKGITNIREVVQMIQTMESEESCRRFSESMGAFIKMAEEEIIKIQAHESVAMSLVKEITEYFHGDSAKEEAHPFRIFMVVRDFLNVLDRVCKEVGSINERTMVSSAHRFPVPVNPMLPVPINPTLPHIFPTIPGRRQEGSSDDESLSP